MATGGPQQVGAWLAPKDGVVDTICAGPASYHGYGYVEVAFAEKLVRPIWIQVLSDRIIRTYSLDPYGVNHETPTRRGCGPWDLQAVDGLGNKHKHTPGDATWLSFYSSRRKHEGCALSRSIMLQWRPSWSSRAGRPLFECTTIQSGDWIFASFHESCIFVDPQKTSTSLYDPLSSACSPMKMTIPGLSGGSGREKHEICAYPQDRGPVAVEGTVTGMERTVP
ncbi:hypothetical protein BD779DRAFT_1472690 [Infundibulicybe gibba]|nr:hypothetical protein BD779DRAFT_1472690 [Infundibulicybe gibba]